MYPFLNIQRSSNMQCFIKFYLPYPGSNQSYTYKIGYLVEESLENLQALKSPMGLQSGKSSPMGLRWASDRSPMV